MAKDIFIGVDGGGTKSKVRIEDSQGCLLGEAVSGPANIRLSVEQAWQSIFQAIREALAQSGLSMQDPRYDFYAGMGLAGCEVKQTYNEFISHPHPFKTLQVASDAHTACLGAHGGKDGAIIIIGTGVIGYQIIANKISRVSGWGFPHDDEGGGAWLGLEATRLTFEWLDRRIEKNALVEEIFAFFDRDFEQFVAWANRANSTEFARLAPIVINQSQHKEPHAEQLMKTAAHAIECIWNALKKSQPLSTSINCCLFGGVARFVKPWLGDEMQQKIVQHQADADRGAIFMVRNNTSIS